MTTETPGFQPASFIDPTQRPKVRRVDINVLYADGSAAHHLFEGNCRIQSGVTEAVFEEIQSFQRDRPLRQVAGTAQFVVTGVDPAGYSATLYPNPAETERLKAEYAANAKLLAGAKPKLPRTLNTDEIREEGLALKFQLGQLLKIPARHNPVGTPHKKRDNVWEVTKVQHTANAGGLLSVKCFMITVEDRARTVKQTFMPGSLVASSVTKVDQWPLRRGDFVKHGGVGRRAIYKLVQPVKDGDQLLGTTSGKIYTQGQKAWHTRLADGSAAWDWEKDLVLVDRDQVKITKKAETWSV